MRRRMLQAARSGDIEQLRPLLGIEDKATQLSRRPRGRRHRFPQIAFGRRAGREVLAIIVDLLDTGYVHLNAGKDDEVYVYFFLRHAARQAGAAADRPGCSKSSPQAISEGP